MKLAAPLVAALVLGFGGAQPGTAPAAVAGPGLAYYIDEKAADKATFDKIDGKTVA